MLNFYILTKNSDNFISKNISIPSDKNMSQGQNASIPPYCIQLRFFFLYIKMTNNYYQKHKERLWKEIRKRYLNFTKEEEKKKT